MVIFKSQLNSLISASLKIAVFKYFNFSPSTDPFNSYEISKGCLKLLIFSYLLIMSGISINSPTLLQLKSTNMLFSTAAINLIKLSVPPNEPPTNDN